MSDEEQLQYFERGYRWIDMNDEQRRHTEALRAAALAYNRAIMLHAPASRRRSLALTHLEEASSFAIKAVALGE